MAQVIDAKGKSFASKRPRRRSAVRPTARPTRSTAPSSASWPTRAPGRLRPRSATKCAAAARKPWRQKGTGRARQGSIRSPQWAHGGVVFGPQPRSYVSSLNKKERRAAMRAALSDKFQTGGMTVLDTTSLDLTKTKALATLLFGSPKAAKTGTRTLVVFATDELATVGTSLRRTGATCRGSRSRTPASSTSKTSSASRALVLTTAAHDALVGKYTQESK